MQLIPGLYSPGSGCADPPGLRIHWARAMRNKAISTAELSIMRRLLVERVAYRFLMLADGTNPPFLLPAFRLDDR